jgi:hypothetical protein
MKVMKRKRKKTRISQHHKGVHQAFHVGDACSCVYPNMDQPSIHYQGLSAGQAKYTRKCRKQDVEPSTSTG